MSTGARTTTATILTASIAPEDLVPPEVVAGSPAATTPQLPWPLPRESVMAEPDASGWAGLVADALAIPAAAFIPPRCAGR